MRKSLTAIICTVIFSLSLSGCSGENYPFEYIGFYDTHIRQNIDITSSKDKITKILGKSSKYSNGFYDYDDGFYLSYDDNNNIRHMGVYDPWGDFDADENHFELPGGINCSSTVTEFIDLYDNVYEYKDDYTFSPTVAIFIEKKDKGYKILNKEDMVKIGKKEQEYNTVYKMSVEYISYDNISSLEIERIDFPEFTDWETVLTEI